MHVELLPQAFLLDRYQLIGEIASGGMATVYLARIAGVGGFQRLVAIKRLHPHLAKQAEFVEMFLDEARLAASIHHRNVVPILEIGTTDGGYYLVMEYIEGVTLARLLSQAAMHRQPVPQAILLRVMVDVLSGLQTAHELCDDQGRPLGLVHRDCTPQNVLIGLDGCARITDFGVARASFRISDTEGGAVKGKLAYIAPEQAQGAAIDRRADLFTLGVMLWEVLAGRRLFKAATEAATLRRILVEPIPSLSEAAPSVHAALAAVCKKALDRNPEERFQSAAAMADALELAARETAAEGAIATERQVEAHMQSVYASDVTAQRDAVRAWLASTPSTVGAAPPSEPILLSTPRASMPSSLQFLSSVPSLKADGEEDATQIYDSTSTTGVITARPSFAPPPFDADVLAAAQRMRPRWPFARLALGAVAVGLVTGVGMLLVAGQRSAETRADPLPGARAPSSTAAQGKTSEPDEPPEVSAPVPGDPATGAATRAAIPPRGARAPGPPAEAGVATAPSATTEIAPPPPPPSKPVTPSKRPDELDSDLANPYR